MCAYLQAQLITSLATGSFSGTGDYIFSSPVPYLCGCTFFFFFPFFLSFKLFLNEHFLYSFFPVICNETVQSFLSKTWWVGKGENYLNYMVRE